MILHPTAEVEGDIFHQTLSISEGAQFDGRVRRAKDAEELRPNLDVNSFPMPAANGTRLSQLRSASNAVELENGAGALLRRRFSVRRDQNGRRPLFSFTQAVVRRLSRPTYRQSSRL